MALRLPSLLPAWFAALLGLGLALKAFVVATFMPRIWLFLDELFYLVTAYDMCHWGRPGVPHPDFLFYPPLPSVLLVPLHAVGLPAPVVYHAGLLLFHALLTSAVVAGYLLLRRLFGESSRLLAAVLILGPPAYTALLLMSEPAFITLYTWFLYFWLRIVQDRHARDAWIAGLLLAGMVLTRFAGYLAVVSLALAAAVDFAVSRDRKRLALSALALVLPVAVALLWHDLAAPLKAEGTQSPLFVMAIAVSCPLGLALGTLRRLVAEVGYVSLSTFGFALPAALWGLARSAPPGERGRELRLFLLNVLVFLVLASGIAAAFMWFGRLLSDLPRFDVYGRYVEYFGIPLLVVAFGVLAALRQGSRHRLVLAAGALLLNATFLFFIPEVFFTRSLENQVAPNSLGIAWLLALVGRLGLWSRWLAPVLAALLTWGLTARGGLRRAAGAVLLMLACANFALGLREVSINSVGSAVWGSAISDFILAHPERFAGGLYVDYPDYRREVGPAAQGHSLVFRVIADHVDKVTAGTEPERYLGRMPVLTKRTFDRPVLAEWPGVPFRIYAANP
jgi:hypothetical protein